MKDNADDEYKISIKLAKILLEPLLYDLINSMPFRKIIPFLHCKIWCQHIV